MQSLSEVWVVYRSYSGDTGAWAYREQEIISEHFTEFDAKSKARKLDFDKAPGDTCWHYVRKMTRQVTYH